MAVNNQYMSQTCNITKNSDTFRLQKSLSLSESNLAGALNAKKYEEYVMHLPLHSGFLDVLSELILLERPDK